MMPAEFIDNLSGSFGILEVPYENVGAFYAHFALILLRKVFHFRNVHQFNAATRDWWTYMFWYMIAL